MILDSKSKLTRFFATVLHHVAFASCLAIAAETTEPEVAVREAWRTSRISGSPEPPPTYTTERTFPSLQFKDCVDLVAEPGTNRLFLVEQLGKIFSFPNTPDASKADLAIDFTQAIPGVEQTYALAFHPDYVRNRYCYICYIKKAELADGTHVARFKMTETDPPTIDVASETTIITWLSGGHNGCCLKFGPDGYLYISTGDGAGPNPPDTLKTGQDCSDLLSSILRIDVDRSDGDKNFRIPPDNPFVETPGVRGEIWAYGLRNPWRMSFDAKTGDLWVGDVGWELWELLHRVERGGNYGWAVMEGRQPTQPEWPRGPTAILPPTIDHPHTESSSITDGLTHYGSRLPELNGMHIYGDYDTGKFWGFRYVDDKVVDHRELADTAHRVVGFGEDQNGEFYILDHTAGSIHRLIENPKRNSASAFPRVLGESGLFASIAAHSPAPGVIPYSVKAEPWADYASAERLVAVPNGQSIKGEVEKWVFPADSVLVKTLSLELRQGEPASRRRIETQLLHFDGVQWQPYSYQWNDDQSDASLVGAAGSERMFDVADPAAPGGIRRQTWRYSARAECQRCHNLWSGPVLGFNAAQLHQEAFSHPGLIDGLAVATVRSSADEVDRRARDYLHANCAHCHRMHAGGSVLAFMHNDLPPAQMNMIGVRPAQGALGIRFPEIIAPGDPERSVLYCRMAKLGPGRMPHLGSTEVDLQGLALIRQWIEEMPPHADADPAALVAAEKLRIEQRNELERIDSAVEPADQASAVKRLLDTTNGALRLMKRIDDTDCKSPVAVLTVEAASRHDDATVRELFERFLSPDRRVRRLGGEVNAQQLLAMEADAERGRRLFFETEGVVCKSCHRVLNNGKPVGPDLTTIGKKLTRQQLLDSILAPSQRIEPQYIVYLAELDDGRQLTGLLVSQDESEVVLKDAQDNLLRLPREGIERLAPQPQSLMPELLLRDMTAQQVADLLAWLGSLK